MKLVGNTVTVTLPSNKANVAPVGGTVKTNFQNLTQVKQNPVAIVSNPASNVIKASIPATVPAVKPVAPVIQIKPVGIVDTRPQTAPVAPVTTVPDTRNVIQPIIDIKPVGIVDTKPNNGTITVTKPVVKTPTLPVSGITIQPIGIVDVKPNPITSPLPAIKPAVPSSAISIKTQLFDSDATLPYVNVWIDGKAVTGSDINGNVSLNNVGKESQVMFSFVGYKSQTFLAKNVPAKIILQTDDMLDEVEIKNNYSRPASTDENNKPSWFWWILALTGVVIYAGYKYTQDSKTKKIVKTKI